MRIITFLRLQTLLVILHTHHMKIIFPFLIYNMIVIRFIKSLVASHWSLSIPEFTTSSRRAKSHALFAPTCHRNPWPKIRLRFNMWHLWQISPKTMLWLMDVVFFSFIYLHFNRWLAVGHFAKDHFAGLWNFLGGFWSANLLMRLFFMTFCLFYFIHKSGVRCWLVRLLGRFGISLSRRCAGVFSIRTVAQSALFQNANGMWTNFHVLNAKEVLHGWALIRLFFPIDPCFLLIGLYQVVLRLIFSNFNLVLPSALQLLKMLPPRTLKVSLASLRLNILHHLSELCLVHVLVALLQLQLAKKWQLRKLHLFLYNLHFSLYFLNAFFIL